MGIASLYGYTNGIEPYLWIAIALIIPVIIAKSTTHKLFLHGLYAGIAIGIVKSLIQTVFFEMYLLHNPGISEGLQSSALPFNVRIFMASVGVFAGIIYGLILGGLAAAASRFHQPK